MLPSPLKPALAALRSAWLVRAAYALAVGYFVAGFASLHVPETGYTWLIRFNAEFHEPKLPQAKAVPHHVHQEASMDGQFHAQIALSPLLRKENLPEAIDNFPYRARRILFSWTAFALGLGQPAWVLQAYAVQNALFWLLLAGLLLRWLPPVSWQNAVRYAGTLYSLGLMQSVMLSLLDGPALALIALGACALESGRRWLGAGLLAGAALGKETSLLAAGALWRPEERRPSWRTAAQLILVALPLLLWLAYVHHVAAGRYGETLGARNFSFPFVGWLDAWLMTIKLGGEYGFGGPTAWKLVALFALTLQAAYFLLRPKPHLLWWRVGAAFACLAFLLGPNVWEGAYGSGFRAVLPLALAFNLVFTRKAWGWPILVAANLSAIAGFGLLDKPNLPRTERVVGPAGLVLHPQTARPLRYAFDDGWSDAEGGRRRYWRWSSGEGAIRFDNPHPRPVEARFVFNLRTLDARAVEVSLNAQLLATLEAEEADYKPVSIEPIVLQPGKNRLVFRSPKPPRSAPPDPRPLAFALYLHRLELLRFADAADGKQAKTEHRDKGTAPPPRHQP